MEQVIATPTIPMQDLEIQQKLDGEYVEVELPSNFLFYDFKHLYIKTLKMKNIRKLIQGQSNKNVRYMAEVLNSCIRCENPQITDLVYRLTQEDFTYLMYWERLHSLPAMPFNHVCECTNPEHIANVEKGNLPEKSLLFTQQITKSTFNTVFLELKSFEIDQSKYISPNFSQAYPSAKVKVPKVKDYLDMLDLAEKEIVKDDAEGQIWFLTGVAACRLYVSDANGRELSFKERFDILDDLDPESFYLFKESENLFPEYGVNEWINVRCPRCGAVSKTRVVLTAYSFLPTPDYAGNIR